jgi:CRP/FNR family cyclic AMP-dependent transcriptional regulator
VPDFLAALAPSDRQALLALGVRRRYEAGTVLAYEGDGPGSVIVVLSGEVAASTTGAAGKEVLLGLARAGEIVGELSAARGRPRSATLTARTDLEAAVVPAADFRAFLRSTPDAAVLILDTVVERLMVADAQRRELAAMDVLARVASRLLELHDHGGANGMVDVTHEELAAWTGSSREGVTKALSVLRSLGSVQTHRGAVELLDVDALRRRAAV